MNTPTLSQLADIGAAAALKHTTGTPVCMLDTMTCYSDHRSAREAFAKAVLDAVGYKLPVDPEREAFDAWMKEHESVDLTYFEAWKAGRAAMLAEQVNHEVVMPHPDSAKPQPETFEAHGLTWIKHTPGDPMPCGGDAMLHYVMRCAASQRPSPAHDIDWKTCAYSPKTEVIGWRYADAP